MTVTQELKSKILNVGLFNEFRKIVRLVTAALPALIFPLIAYSQSEKPPGIYYVTVTNKTYAQGFSFPVGATHQAGYHLFDVGEYASDEAAIIAQTGSPTPMFNKLKLDNEVTDIYVHPFPISSQGAGLSYWPAGLPFFDNGEVPNLYPTPTAHLLPDKISFTIIARPKDRFSLLMMLMCTNDALAGLDAVLLPTGVGEVIEYNVFAYDTGVEANTELGPDIVEPCGFVAPLDNGNVQVPNNDGNYNSPPSGADASLATNGPIALFSDPAITGNGDIPAAFNWPAREPVATVTITLIKVKKNK